MLARVDHPQCCQHLSVSVAQHNKYFFPLSSQPMWGWLGRRRPTTVTPGPRLFQLMPPVPLWPLSPFFQVRGAHWEFLKTEPGSSTHHSAQLPFPKTQPHHPKGCRKLKSDLLFAGRKETDFSEHTHSSLCHTVYFKLACVPVCLLQLLLRTLLHLLLPHSLIEACFSGLNNITSWPAGRKLPGWRKMKVSVARKWEQEWCSHSETWMKVKQISKHSKESESLSRSRAALGTRRAKDSAFMNLALANVHW